MWYFQILLRSVPAILSLSTNRRKRKINGFRDTSKIYEQQWKSIRNIRVYIYYFLKYIHTTSTNVTDLNITSRN
jgi:hypothetical protein